jgi:hypothetical protein
MYNKVDGTRSVEPLLGTLTPITGGRGPGNHGIREEALVK